MQHEPISLVLVVLASVSELDLHLPIRHWAGLCMHCASQVVLDVAQIWIVQCHAGWRPVGSLPLLWDVHSLLLSTKGGSGDMLRWEEG